MQKINVMSDYITTEELASYLRIKSRKVYDLVSKNQVPFKKVMGKLLFSKKEVDEWLDYFPGQGKVIHCTLNETTDGVKRTIDIGLKPLVKEKSSGKKVKKVPNTFIK